jgi:proliferating cell nuclear antigen
LAKILKCCSNGGDGLVLKADRDGHVLNISLEGGERVGEFELKLINLQCDQLLIPSYDFDYVIDMPSFELCRITKDLGQFGDTMIIKCSEDGISFAVKGLFESCCVQLTNGAVIKNWEKLSIERKSHPGDNKVGVLLVVQKVSVKYMMMFAKIAPLAERVFIIL